MVRTQHSIVSQVYAAKTDPDAADGLIRQYIGFIRSEVVKFTHAAPEDGYEDELSIAMFAFYEAILGYERVRGAFLPYAARAIRNRLVDAYRREKRHRNVASLHDPSTDGADRTLLETLPDTRDEIADLEARTASQQEIRTFGEQLGRYGIAFSDVADNCPRQERTMAACRRVLDYARSHQALLDRLVESGRLPIGELSAGSGMDKKTLERHRKYLVAILIAFTNGYEIIRGHLGRLAPPKGGSAE